jgi:hypothetical protein
MKWVISLSENGVGKEENRKKWIAGKNDAKYSNIATMS